MDEASEESTICRTWMNLALIVFINVMNLCDRFILAVLIQEIEDDFHIDNDLAGLLQSAFYILYVFAVPVYGYLGDRFNRKYILVFSLSIWNASNLACSYIKSYWGFFTMRMLFGLGSAGSTTINPVIISDLFLGPKRSKALAFYYLAIPTGLGLAYILGRELEVAFGSWRWSLRVTPIIGFFTIVLLVVVMKEPVRGQIENKVFSPDLLINDVRYLSKNTSFVLATCAFVCTAFTTQAMVWWVPQIVFLGAVINNHPSEVDSIMDIFGLIIIVSGTVGIVTGYVLSSRLKDKFPQVDPVVSGLSLMVAIPIFVAASFCIPINAPASFVLFGFGFVLANMNWVLTTDILLSVVLPNKRALALGIQLLAGHALGSFSSPYILGLLSVYFRNLGLSKDEQWNKFLALEFASFAVSFALLVGSVLLMVCGCFIVEDTKTMKSATQ